jgi:enamine deaminase RidA (YjgF/YER057c/UK114 family)
LKLGDTTAVREANSLAIECKTDQALAALDRATREGGLGAAVADLQRVVILRDAGRMAEAEIAMNERNRRWNADAKNVAESEAAVTKAVNELRANRQEKTGQTICH